MPENFDDDSAKGTMRECLGLKEDEKVPEVLFAAYKEMEKRWAMANSFPTTKDLYGLIVQWNMIQGGEKKRTFERKPSEMLEAPKRGPGRPRKNPEPVGAT